MPIANPAQLVDAFKKSGEFDRLRRELLSEFQQGNGVDINEFKSKIESYIKNRLVSDEKLKYLPQETVQRELMLEVDRYPTVERAATDMAVFSDPTFLSNIQTIANRLLLEDRGLKPVESPMHPDSIAASSIRPTPIGTPSAHDRVEYERRASPVSATFEGRPSTVPSSNRKAGDKVVVEDGKVNAIATPLPENEVSMPTTGGENKVLNGAGGSDTA
ncbi:uncharacterized protein BT62DRAFT_932251 [Guyanagaster necrorhizus]|uniref:BOD1/SHG1 domain-containing protein n=1 Tax=Guyanagaster necrorhizus TaxID=856835 RepID=A0A9P7VSA0_9AGAR|nr:uncharacterized protein BT62DRAFT_932251 [Guyanagaster necrorhizus MCA 3950]KAG7445907.1 hypothetical protein BT62DRAFT_932251 [Guyanagaster necrorhizus MCA 3950]